MAIYRYSMGGRVSRGGGETSSLRSAAYLARDCFEDRRLGHIFDFRTGSPIEEASDHIARQGHHAELESQQQVLYSDLAAPAQSPDWCHGAANIERFWNAAEAAERRKDAVLAERIIIALPQELTLQQNIWLVKEHAREFTREGRVVQVAIHSPEPGHDDRNLHAHLLVSSRGVDEHGMKTSKAVEMQDRFMNRAAYTTSLRESWANLANRYLEKFGHEARIDHRSYQTQGLDREPTVHLGPGDAERERQGIRTLAGDHNREVQARNAERERQALDRAAAERHDPSREAGIVQSAQPAPTVATVHDRRRQDREQETHEATSTKAFEHAPGSFPAGIDAAAANWALRATVEDLAKELSPAYCQALEKVAELEREFKDAARAYQSAALDGQQARSRQGTRRAAMGGLRRFMHDHGLWKDADLQRWEKRGRGAAYGETKRGIEVATLRDQFAAARWTAEAEREAIHDRAQAELRARRDAALERLAPRDRLDVLRWYDHKAAGLAPLELPDVAREISPAYRRAAAVVTGLEAELQRAEYAHGRAERDAALASDRTEERRQALGITERDLAKGRFADLELTNAASKELGADFTEQKQGMRIEAVREQLAEAEKRANEQFERVKPQAEVELKRRQHIAQDAREQLRPIQEAEQLQRQQQRQRRQSQGFGL